MFLQVLVASIGSGMQVQRFKVAKQLWNAGIKVCSTMDSFLCCHNELRQSYVFGYAYDMRDIS